MTEVKWGSYRDFEGPWVAGSARMRVVDRDACELDKRLAVVTATEGGTYDAINMYDTMICSAGLIQLGEKNQCSVSDLLGSLAEACGTETVTNHLEEALVLSGASFRKNHNGVWRFVLDAPGVTVSTAEEQRKMWLGCSGKKGAWTPESVTRATTWARCLNELLASPVTHRAQEEHVKRKLMRFVTPQATALLFSQERANRMLQAVRAAYVSFAANLPAVASSQLERAARDSVAPVQSVDWCLDILKVLVFGPAISIYPGRYDKIRPELERLYDVVLPKTHVELSEYSYIVARPSDLLLIPPETKRE